MAKNEERLKLFKEQYDSFMEVIKAISDDYNYHSRGYNPDYKDIDLRIPFDILIQFSLLQTSAANGKHDEEEIMFIKNNFKYGDLITFTHKLELDWDYTAFYSASDEILNKYILSFKDNVIKGCYLIIKVVHSFNTENKISILKAIRKGVQDLMQTFAYGHGFISTIEANHDYAAYEISNLIKKDILDFALETDDLSFFKMN